MRFLARDLFVLKVSFLCTSPILVSLAAVDTLAEENLVRPFILFDNKTIEVVVDGSKKPYTDVDGVPHDWYGRCMIAIIDEHRWIMALSLRH